MLPMRPLRAAAAAFLLAGIWAGQAQAQNALAVGGALTGGHLLMSFGGRALDAGGPVTVGGSPQNSALPGTRPTGLGIVNPGLGNCQWTGYSNAAYAQLCWGFDGNGNGVLSLGNFGLGTNPSFSLSAPGNVSLTAGGTASFIASGNLSFTSGGTLVATGTGTGLALFGSPTAPTPAVNDNSTRLATTAFVATQLGSVGTAPIPFVPTNAALAALAQATTTRAMRLGVTVQGDSPPVVFNAQTGNCAAAGLVNDVGSCVNGPDGNSWKASFVGPINAGQFGLSAASIAFHTITTVKDSCTVTDASGGWSSANVGELIDIAGAGPNELHYISSVTAVADATHFTVASPCPTLAMEVQSVIVHHGKDNGTALNNASIAAKARGVGLKIPGNEYLSSIPFQCTVPNLNNFNLGQAGCTGDPGAVIKAMSSMASSTPQTNVLMTTGNFASAIDYTQYIRQGTIEGGGLTLDCSFIANKGHLLPFSQEVTFRGFYAKNCLVAGLQFGANGAPTATAALTAQSNKVDRDILYNTVTNITRAHPPVVTTVRDHGVTDGRIVMISGANNIPLPGPIAFIAKSTGPRTLELHNVDGTGWAAFAGTAQLALTFPTNAQPHPIFAVSNANPAVVQIDGDLGLANGENWCLYGIGVTGGNGGTAAPTNVPDGCYVISNVSGAGGDGAYSFTVPVNGAGITFTGGGFAIRQDAIADMGLYLENISDAQLSDNFVVGTRWPYYGKPSGTGFNTKFSNNHASNFMEQGWITACHILGGSNSLSNEQCDGPANFHSIFTSGANSSSGDGFNGAFNFLPDGFQIVHRLDAGASLTVHGGNANGFSGSIRVSQVSNNFLAGNPPYFGPIFNYKPYGFGNGGSMLYTMPDATYPNVFFGRPSNPVNTASATAVAMGLGAGGCAFTIRKAGVVNFEIYGSSFNTTSGKGAFGQLYIGTGTAPANGAALGGGTVAVGAEIPMPEIEPVSLGQFPFKVGGILASNLTLNQTYWMDLAERQAGGGAAGAANLACAAVEY